MVFIILFAVAAVVAIYFAARFYLLRSSIRKADAELKDINDHITENYVLRLPAPDRELGAFMNTVNNTLERIRRERVSYAAREREFRSQIEAISHDLRTPLTVIIGYLKVMECDGPDGQTMEVVLRKARSMQKLIAAFYEYSRIIADDYTLEPAPLDAGRLLRETFADNCVMLEGKGLKVDTSFCDYPVKALADSAALERVIVNLIQNAARYARTFFLLTFDRVGENAVAVFENDAEGLTEDTLEHIFDRFYMADGSRSMGGTGLGLTIAKSLAEQMCGSLTADIASAPVNIAEEGGKAIRFTLTLPALKA